MPCCCLNAAPAALQGYFQLDVGGKTIPVATGELSDLAGDEPLFKALYKWGGGGGGGGAGAWRREEECPSCIE